MSDNNFSEKNFIFIKGAKVNNLKNIDIKIPRGRLVVITGLSGSGKSSLAFNTLYAEGQRRYVESLSSYARQFMGKMHKPEVDFINGIPPAIAIEQKTNSVNPRSTVGTSTEIYEYLKLLFARIGKTYSPITNQIVRRDSVRDVINFINEFENNSKISITSPIVIKNNRTNKEHCEVLIQQGYSRVVVDNEIFLIEDIIENEIKVDFNNAHLLIDRFTINKLEQNSGLWSDSIESAFFEGDGKCVINIISPSQNITKLFTNRFEKDGIAFEEPSVNLFSFNNSYGACKTCEGYGNVLGLDEDLVIPNKFLSVYEDAIACWKYDSGSDWKTQLIKNASKFDFPIHRPIYDLSAKEYELLWNGNQYFEGINSYFKFLEDNSYKIQNRVFLSRFRGKTICPDCKGTRLRSDANFVKIAGKTISEMVLMQIDNLLDFFKKINFDNDFEKNISQRLITEISTRLQYINDVGLGYLTLNRLSNSLSGGESQRLRIATSLGSSLVGALYILDEPSIGLHSKDTQKLLKVLKYLRDLGNSVIVVEHDLEIIREADFIIDIGPMAGRLGGEVVFSGTLSELQSSNSLTAKYISNNLSIDIPQQKRKWKDYIEVFGARENNLKNVNVKIPLKIFTVVTGVSGSGKTTLIRKILFLGLRHKLGLGSEKAGTHLKIEGDIALIKNIELIDQNPIGKSTRSNPATYTKVFDEIRQLFSEIPLSIKRNYKPGFFSFNVPGGRCEECEGEGIVRIPMQFMADVELTCDNCKGKRYKNETLDITFFDKNISDILNLTIDEAIEFFSTKKNKYIAKIIEKLKPLTDVGLGYLKLGQASSTLSGGEAQRVKLASFLIKGNSENSTLFIFDEPTTGLHIHDLKKLIKSFDLLLNKGHTIVVIEHNSEIIKCSDWEIELGHEGGDKGGSIIFEGQRHF